MLTQSRLKQLLRYNKKTGVFTWLVDRGVMKCAGWVAGCINGSGYVIIKIDYRLYYGHQLAWLYVYGEWPNRLDHKDENRNNNRIKNLREVTRSQNAVHSKLYRTNTSGQRGVHFRNGAWCVRIMKDGKRPEFRFKNKLDAILAAQQVGLKLYGRFWKER
jgi:hypothetical protein